MLTFPIKSAQILQRRREQRQQSGFMQTVWTVLPLPGLRYWCQVRQIRIYRNWQAVPVSLEAVLSIRMTGINWSTNPVALLELGFMTNPTDDANMQDDTYQQLMVRGIADGIDAYFGR